MNEDHITCDICRDLIPLVKDGVASADSEEAVRKHIESCKECGSLFDGKQNNAPQSEPSKSFRRVKRRLTIIYAALMLLGIYFGLSLTSGMEQFYNCLIMPVVGVFGYLAFRWKALFTVPILLMIVQAVINGFGLLGSPHRIDFLSPLIYSIFALSGTIIVMLLRYAFGKTKPDSERSGEK